jgi:plastocyanin domain-containing protein
MFFINLIGIIFISLIVWWFWLYKPVQLKKVESGLVIRVENGSYQPSHLLLEASKASVIKFQRLDPSPCAETVVFPDLDLSMSLPLNKEVSITLPALKAGKYDFHCQMQMIRGDIEVK